MPTGFTWQKAVFLVVAAFCITPWSRPEYALALGVLLALLIENPFRAQGSKVSKPLLQASVVLLGFGMNFMEVLKAGASGFTFAAVSIAATLLLGYLLTKLLGIDKYVGALISSGTAICGGSAIAAVGSALDCDDGDMTVAIGTVFLLNAIALYLFPFLGHQMNLTEHQFGVWAGIAIHDVSSVVGAATSFGGDAPKIATAVKLSRVLWIVPLVVAMVFAFRAKQKRIQIPWFIGLFLVASLCNRILSKETADVLTRIAKTGLSLTLFLIGAGLTVQTLKAVGARALLQGVLLWVFIGTTSLLVILKMM